MKTKHTAGPWAVSSSVIVVAPEDKRDCPVICNTMDLVRLSGFPLEEAKANAALIAAAPELLEALKRFQQCAAKGNWLSASDVAFISEVALPAISKAEGQP